MTSGSEDRVVRELDIYICNGLLGSSTTLQLFQYPLRPPWRPYGEENETEKVRYKPGVRKVEMEIPIETPAVNVNSHADGHMQLRTHRLSSSKVELKTSYAVGSVRGDKVLLCQLDDAVQMRPSLTHMDAKEKEGPRASQAQLDKPDAADTELKAVQVTYERKETERQREARKQSHAYLKQQEDEEPWVELTYHSADSTAADTIWEKLMTPGGQDIKADLCRMDYLAALVPTLQVVTAAPTSDQGAGAADAPAPMDEDHAPAPAQASSVSAEAQAALPGALSALFRHHNVCSLENIRKWLREYPEAGAASEASGVSDVVLNKAINDCPSVTSIRGSFLLAKTGVEEVDTFRSLLLGLLRSSRQVRRTEILEAARETGVSLNDSMCTKVIKSICISRGNFWCLKSGI